MNNGSSFLRSLSGTADAAAPELALASLPPVREEQRMLAVLTNSFQTLLGACPPEVRGRQWVLTRREPGFLYVEIKTTFKIPLPTMVGSEEEKAL